MKTAIKFKIRTPYNRVKADYDRERNTAPSMTIPDQSMSIKELLRRKGQGMEVPQFNPIYSDDDEELPDFRRMDRVEIDNYRMRLQEDILDMRQHLKEVAAFQAQPKEDKNEKQSPLQPSQQFDEEKKDTKGS